MRVDQFDFDLPEESIALRPAGDRVSSRLLSVIPGDDPEFADQVFSELPNLLRDGDLLIANNTKVIPARLRGNRANEMGTAHIEITLHMRIDGHRWLAFAKPAKRLKPGDTIEFAPPGNTCLVTDLNARVEDKGEGGEVTLAFDYSGPALDDAIAANGEMPLPPYIAGKRKPDAQDITDYQTLHAQVDGAVAAPTAGLHFTPELIETLRQKGVGFECLTLHVGAGTFLPVKADDTGDHKMHAEWGEISDAMALRINQTRKQGGRIVAVGTTSLRLLESAALQSGEVKPFAGETDIFITPGYRFKAVDLLLTNFHLPRSTLFMLVSAFSGLERLKRAYAHAISSGYRFYSYGDACLLSPEQTQ